MKVNKNIKVNNLIQNPNANFSGNRLSNFIVSLTIVFSLIVYLKIISNYSNHFLTSNFVNEQMIWYGIGSTFLLIPFLMIYVVLSKISLSTSFNIYSMVVWPILISTHLVISFLFQYGIISNVTHAMIISVSINAAYIIINLLLIFYLKKSLFAVFKKLFLLHLLPFLTNPAILIIYLLPNSEMSFSAFYIFENPLRITVVLTIILLSSISAIWVQFVFFLIRKQLFTYRFSHSSKLRYETFFICIWAIFPLQYFKNIEIDFQIIITICLSSIIFILSVAYVSFLHKKVKFNIFILGLQSLVIMAISINAIFMDQSAVAFKSVFSTIILGIAIVASYIVLSISTTSYSNSNIPSWILVILVILFCLYICVLYMPYLNLSIWFMTKFLSVDLTLIIISLFAIYILWIHKIILTISLIKNRRKERR